MLSKLRPKNISANGGFSLIEIISVLSIISILVSITYPSLRRYFIQLERDSYLAKLNSFLEQIKRETRRYGISCDLKTIEINNFKSEANEVPKITKNIFQFVSGDLTFTPKGQVYVNNKRNFGNSYVIVVGLKEQSNGFNDSLRCLLVNPPTGVIDNGVYITKYQTQYDYGISRYNSFLVDRFCSKK